MRYYLYAAYQDNSENHLSRKANSKDKSKTLVNCNDNQLKSKITDQIKQNDELGVQKCNKK